MAAIRGKTPHGEGALYYGGAVGVGAYAKEVTLVGSDGNPAGPALTAKTAAILNTATLSAAVDLGGARLAGLIFPATFVGTSVGIQVSDAAAGTYVDLYDAYGTLVAITCAASKATILPFADFIGVRFLKVKAASAQNADISISILTA